MSKAEVAEWAELRPLVNDPAGFGAYRTSSLLNGRTNLGPALVESLPPAEPAHAILGWRGPATDRCAVYLGTLETAGAAGTPPNPPEVFFELWQGLECRMRRVANFKITPSAWQITGELVQVAGNLGDCWELRARVDNTDALAQDVRVSVAAICDRRGPIFAPFGALVDVLRLYPLVAGDYTVTSLDP